MRAWKLAVLLGAVLVVGCDGHSNLGHGVAPVASPTPSSSPCPKPRPHALALELQAVTGTTSTIRRGEVTITFYDLTQTTGPFKLYVGTAPYPAAPGCDDCAAPVLYVVQPEQIYQRWPGGGPWVRITFAHALVGGLEPFYFSATTVDPSGEQYIASGVVPSGKGGQPWLSEIR